MKHSGISLLLLFCLLASGCATLCPPEIPFLPERPLECQELLTSLDEKVEEAGMKDGASFSVPHFPYLRYNRFLSALKKHLNNDEERRYWIAWMQELDLGAREKEISNLPEEAILSMDSTGGVGLDREELWARVKSCSCKLLDHDQRASNLFATLDPFVEAPDEYSFLMRAVGLYPIAWIPVTIVTRGVRERFKTWFHGDLEGLSVKGSLMTFAPAEADPLGERKIEEIIKVSRKNPLEISRPDLAQRRRLVASLAPIFIQDVAAPHDRFGRVFWMVDRLGIDSGNPTVYWYISHTFLKGQPVIQINYVIWYSERAGKSSPWIERGRLDGLTVRVSLDTQGKPFMVDVMNNCGCYHLFSPEKEHVCRVVPKPLALDPFVPQWLPLLSGKKRLGIRVNSGWHQVQRLLAETSPPDAVSYELVPYELLEALPHQDGRTESIFSGEGIAKGSDRIEPFLLFSMGIPSVGSMRQRGHHAISLTDRVHFDDPHLFDRHFVFK